MAPPCRLINYLSIICRVVHHVLDNLRSIGIPGHLVPLLVVSLLSLSSFSVPKIISRLLILLDCYLPLVKSHFCV